MVQENKINPKHPEERAVKIHGAQTCLHIHSNWNLMLTISRPWSSTKPTKAESLVEEGRHLNDFSLHKANSICNQVLRTTELELATALSNLRTSGRMHKLLASVFTSVK